MPMISFLKDHPSIEVSMGANLMESLLDADLPVASSCGGEAVCSKCRIQIIKGEENLSEETDLELDLKEANDIDSDYRISCQTRVLGDVTVDAPYW